MKKARMFIDIVMVVLLPLLMAYSLIGETTHEIIGICMGILFIAHHILNFRWYRHLFRGKYSFERIVGTCINLALTLIMLLQIISGILISKHIFVFLEINRGVTVGRTIHLLSAYWGFMLMSAHLGLHVKTMSSRMGIKKHPNISLILRYIIGAVSVYGIYAFIKRKIGEYLILKTAFVFFDYNEPVILFLADYAAVMTLTAAVFYYLITAAAPKDPTLSVNRQKKLRSGSMKEREASYMAEPKKKRSKKIFVILGAIFVIALILFFTMGLPYIRRHFIPVRINRAQAAAMAPVDFGDKKILTVQFTRVGNSDFDDDVAAVSSASLMKENDTLIGNSELLSEMIQNATGSDLYAIRTQKKYPSGYLATCNVAKKELDGKEEVVLSEDIPDTSRYDIVFLVYPIWWGTVPKAVETFLNEADLSQAIIYTLVTHGGSKEGSCIRDMKNMTDAVISDNYLTVYDDDADTARDQVASWLMDCAK